MKVLQARMPPEEMHHDVGLFGLLPEHALFDLLRDTSAWFRRVSGVGADDTMTKIMKRFPKVVRRVPSSKDKEERSYTQGTILLGVTLNQARAWWKMLTIEAEQRGMSQDDLSLWARRWMMAWSSQDNVESAPLFADALIDIGSIHHRMMMGLILLNEIRQDSVLLEEIRRELIEDLALDEESVAYRYFIQLANASRQIESRIVEVVPDSAITGKQLSDAVQQNMGYIYDSIGVSDTSEFLLFRQTISRSEGSAGVMSLVMGGVLPPMLNPERMPLAIPGRGYRQRLVKVLFNARRTFLERYGVPLMAGPAVSPGWMDLPFAPM